MPMLTFWRPTTLGGSLRTPAKRPAGPRGISIASTAAWLVLGRTLSLAFTFFQSTQSLTELYSLGLLVAHGALRAAAEGRGGAAPLPTARVLNFGF